MKILLEAPIMSMSGYGEHSRLVYEALEKTPHDIYISPLNWGATSWDMNTIPLSAHACIEKFGEYMSMCNRMKREMSFDIQVHVGLPNEFEKRAPYSVCVTAGIETDRVSPRWLMKTQREIDKIIVPSNHAKQGFETTGYSFMDLKEGGQGNEENIIKCGAPVSVIPYPVKLLEPVPIDLDLKTSFNFLSVALLGPRKNIESSIVWFIREFRDNEDVGFVIKTGISKTSLIDRRKTEKYLKGIAAACGEHKCKIYFIHGNMTEEEIHSLYKHPKIKAYATATHGEGYGLPVFEAAYSGLPVVATDWSAHTEFMTIGDQKFFSRVQYELNEVPKSATWEHILVDGSQWAYPTEESYRKEIREMYREYDSKLENAKILQKHILQNYQKDQILKQYQDAIFEFGSTAEEDEIVIL